MTTLAQALAQSPIHAAWTHSADESGVVEVRALLTDRAHHADAPARSLRYELLTSGTPQVVGSYTEIVDFATHLRAPHGGWATLDWQPVYERAALAPPGYGRDTRHAKGVQ